MGVGPSIVLIAIGAILKFAVTATVSGVSIATVGTILIVVGIVGLVVSLLLMASYRDRGDVIVEEEPPVVERRVVRERGVY
ncbi:MAG: DUF6458 family protein [Solirubrobacteraceae bacterium]